MAAAAEASYNENEAFVQAMSAGSSDGDSDVDMDDDQEDFLPPVVRKGTRRNDGSVVPPPPPAAASWTADALEVAMAYSFTTSPPGGDALMMVSPAMSYDASSLTPLLSRLERTPQRPAVPAPAMTVMVPPFVESTSPTSVAPPPANVTPSPTSKKSRGRHATHACTTTAASRSRSRSGSGSAGSASPTDGGAGEEKVCIACQRKATRRVKTEWIAAEDRARRPPGGWRICNACHMFFYRHYKGDTHQPHAHCRDPTTMRKECKDRLQVFRRLGLDLHPVLPGQHAPAAKPSAAPAASSPTMAPAMPTHIHAPASLPTPFRPNVAMVMEDAEDLLDIADGIFWTPTLTTA